MTTTKFKGWMFLISSALLAACCFMPIATYTAHLANGSKEVSHVSMMPTLPGFVILILALLCAALPLMGLKQRSAIIATVTALISGGLVAYESFSASQFDSAAGAVDDILIGTFGATGSSVVERTTSTGFGLYLFVIAIILVLVTGFIYGIAEDDY